MSLAPANILTMTMNTDGSQPPQPAPTYIPPQPAYLSPKQSGTKGLALTALIVGIVAFLLGLIPVVGILLGLAGIGLGIFALIKKQSKALAITGIVLAACALIASIATTASLGSIDTASKNREATVAPREAPKEAETKPVAEPEEKPKPEPAPEPEPVAPAAPDLATFSETDERSLALIAKDPDSFAGTNIILYGNVTQYDSFTGKCGMRLNVGNTIAEYSFDYKHNTIVYSGDGTSDCPVLAPIVQDDNVKIWMTISGSYSYDTTLGGTATAISGQVWHAEVLPPTEY